MKELIVRLTSETPKFFNWVKGTAVSVGVAATGIINMKGTSPTMISHCETIIWVCGVAGLIAQCARKDVPVTTEVK